MKFLKRQSVLLMVTTVCCPTMTLADHPSLSVLGGPAGPVTTQSTTTVPEGNWTSGISAEYIKFDSFSDEQLANFQKSSTKVISIVLIR